MAGCRARQWPRPARPTKTHRLPGGAPAALLHHQPAAGAGDRGGTAPWPAIALLLHAVVVLRVNNSFLPPGRRCTGGQGGQAQDWRRAHGCDAAGGWASNRRMMLMLACCRLPLPACAISHHTPPARRRGAGQSALACAGASGRASALSAWPNALGCGAATHVPACCGAAATSCRSAPLAPAPPLPAPWTRLGR